MIRFDTIADIIDNSTRRAEDCMLYTLTFYGIALGRVDLSGSPRAVGTLIPLPAFASTGARDVARRLGLALRITDSPRIATRVAARMLGTAVAGAARLQERLGLRDFQGTNVAIVRIVVVSFPGNRWPMVVAKLREQAALSRAELAPMAGGSGERSRSAA